MSQNHSTLVGGGGFTAGESSCRYCPVNFRNLELRSGIQQSDRQTDGLTDTQQTEKKYLERSIKHSHEFLDRQHP